MKRTRSYLKVLSIAALLASGSASAEGELIEKTVVRNRLFTVAGRPELGLNVGFMPMPRLTDHLNVNAHFAYNVSDTMAFELRGGYALSRHTGLANQIAEEVAADATMLKVTDLSDLWELNGNGMVGVRWAPIYGKISLMAELNAHFQAYLWLGAGGGQFHRESITICNQRSGSTCNAFYSEDRVGALASAALGARFFLASRHSLALEVRDYSFPDSYYQNVDRKQAESPASPTGGGELARNAGITNLVQLDVGYSFLF